MVNRDVLILDEMNAIMRHDDDDADNGAVVDWYPPDEFQSWVGVVDIQCHSYLYQIRPSKE
jgi:hypothetical protein